MKAFLVNLLIAFSLALCGFNAYQWYREARLHGRIEALGADLFKKSTEIQELRLTVQSTQDEIQRLEGIRENFAEIIRSNRTVVAALEQEADSFRRDAQAQAAKVAQLEPYRSAFEQANENLKKQNEVIKEQNSRMKELADGRNEIVTRFNQLAADYKSLGDDYSKLLGMYTNLVAQVQASQRGSR